MVMCKRRVVSLALAFLTLAGLTGCNSSVQTQLPPPASGSSSVFLFGKDAPRDNIIKFEITLVSATLDPGLPTQVELLAQPKRLELEHLQLSQALVQIAQNVPARTYTSIRLMFSDPEVKFCPDLPPCSSPIERRPTLTQATITKSVALSLQPSAPSGLLIDFDLNASLNADATTLNPVVTCSVVALNLEDDEFEEEGRVVSITPANAPRGSSGSFVLEAFETCAQVTITINAQTEFDDFDENGLANTFDSLAVNQFVEVEADVLPDGTIQAEEVELEEPDNEGEIEGIVVEIASRNPTTNEVNQFKMIQQQVAPCSNSAAALDDLVTVNVTSTTAFRIDEGELGSALGSLAFNRQNIEVGQNVKVKGAVSGSPPTVTAERLRLEDQTMRGTVISTSGNNFFFDPASNLFPDQMIEVRTISGTTEFEGVAGVGNLVAGQTVRVKGLLFVQTLGSPSQLVLVAEKVDSRP